MFNVFVVYQLEFKFRVNIFGKAEEAWQSLTKKTTFATITPFVCGVSDNQNCFMTAMRISIETFSIVVTVIKKEAFTLDVQNSLFCL